MDTASQAPRATVAAFDVDGTLTHRDSFLPFLLRRAGARLPPAIARRLPALVRALARRDRDGLKQLACASFAGMSEASLRAQGAAYARALYDHRLREDILGRLRRHQELGHSVVLVSASLDVYLEPLGALLEVDGVVCTRLAVDEEGRLTGHLAGLNCRGPEKAVRLRAWLRDAGLADAELWAYGDSAGDDDMLALADHAVSVRGTRIDPRLDTPTD